MLLQVRIAGRGLESKEYEKVPQFEFALTKLACKKAKIGSNVL